MLYLFVDTAMFVDTVINAMFVQYTINPTVVGVIFAKLDDKLARPHTPIECICRIQVTTRIYVNTYKVVHPQVINW